ncbi:hypothetical protein WP8S17C03_26020 [Metapseudomonas otitidis]|uniref:Uncharacterized protein n=1 Tax=Metapseudomonas otitidis TaxID=319939 RepID=A0A6S5RNR3_9GAMM|nr:hypothetical protein [Pseudomonas otitidis]BBT16553.1 hypothetical protein WP8S17C03_26020 [Pseudomonas otitidis]
MASLKDEHAYLDADRFTQRPFSRSSGTRPGSGIRLSTCVDGDFYSCAACVCPALQGWVVPVVINQFLFLEAKLRLTKFRVGLIVFSVIALLIVLWGRHNPLPNDEFYIRRFELNRTEIEALVYEYRHRAERGRVPWVQQAENRKRLVAAGLRQISETSPMWSSRPYSRLFYRRLIQDDAFRDAECGQLLQRCNSIVVDIDAEGGEEENFAVILLGSGFSLVRKMLVYFPVVPKVEERRFQLPVHTYPVDSYARLFESLDDTPPDWARGECVYRRIEQNWFIELCRVEI